MDPEVDSNFNSFENRWRQEWSEAEEGLRSKDNFAKAYSKLVSMQAWRSELLEEALSDEALGFVSEGQNDLLVSYILARSGQWRSALQSLRAAIEAYQAALYFMDHPVELELWKSGKFRTINSEIYQYLCSHPKICSLNKENCGLDLLKSEYATLSKAVHGSAKIFRMTDGKGAKFFSINNESLGRWSTRQKSVVRGLNILLISLFKDSISGAKKRNLRKSIALSLASSDKGWIKDLHGVTIPF